MTSKSDDPDADIARARDDLARHGSGRAEVDAEVARLRREDPGFVPHYPVRAAQVAGYHALPEAERGGFRLQWGEAFDDDGTVEEILAAEAKVLLLSYEEGAWYSNGETGPSWYQFHVGCARRDEDALIEAVRAALAARLGAAAANISIGR